MTGNRKRANPSIGPSPLYVLTGKTNDISNSYIESTNLPIAIYRIHGDHVDYYPFVIAPGESAVEGFTDDLPDVLAEHPGAPKVNKTIDQLRERIKRAVDEMIQGSIGDVRVSFPTMRGIVSYGIHRRPVVADSAKDSLLTIHVNHKGKLTDRYARPSDENMQVKREISDYGQGCTL